MTTYLYALRFIKTKKMVGITMTSEYHLEGYDNDFVVPYTEYTLSDDTSQIWCTSFKETADRIAQISSKDKPLPYIYSSYDFPINPYAGQLEVVEFQITQTF